MCGRFTQQFSWRLAQNMFALDGPEMILRPRYNLAPTQLAAVVRASAGGRELVRLRWGLIPSWARDPHIGHRLINARAETVTDKPAFRDAYARRRCLVPAEGFYEWQRQGSARQPWWIARRDGQLMALAGLWEAWRVLDKGELSGSLAQYRAGERIETFTLLTTKANATVQAIHARMPVMLQPEQYSAWLSGATVPLGSAPDIDLISHPVSTRVNDPRHDDPTLLAHMEPAGEDGIRTVSGQAYTTGMSDQRVV